jgi:hypothetical protein
VLKKLFKPFGDQKNAERRAEQYRNLIRREAKIGGQLFGPVPAGHRREFFCLDTHTWVWYEEWKDASGVTQSKTTRYDVRPNGVVKNQDGHASQYISIEEARNLYHAVKLYNQRVDADLAQFI